ncbi:hypothetical protein Tco_0637158 [Tanacetum coccineum]
MLTEEMKLTDHYKMYDAVFRVDVPTTQSQPIVSTQGTHTTTSALRSPNPITTEGESSAPCKSIVIRFRVPRRQDPKTPIPTAAEIDVTNLHETIQMSIATQRSLEDFEAHQNVAKVNEHLEDAELDHLLEGNQNVDVDEFMNDIFNSQEDPDTRIEPRSEKESPEVEKSDDLVCVNAVEEEEESARDEFELRRRVKGKGIKETKSSPSPTPIISPRTHIAPLSSDKETIQELTVIIEDAPPSADKEKLKELTVTDPTPSSSLPKPKIRRFKRCKSFIHHMGGCYSLLFGHLTKTFMLKKNFNQLSEMLYKALKEILPSMVNKEVDKIAKMTVPIYVAKGLLLERQKTQADIATMIAEAIQKEHDNLRVEVISHVNDAIANHIPAHVDSFLRDYMTNNILHVHPTQNTKSNAQDLQYQLYLMMRNDEQLCNADLVIWLSLKIKFEKITTATACRPSAIRPRDHDDYQDDDARPEGENSAKRQKTFKHEIYSLGESSSGQAMEQDPNPSGSGTQEQLDEFDAWMEDAGTDDDEVPDDKVSQELLEEMSGEIDETQLQKSVDAMLRQRFNLGEEHQYHVDQMQNYLKSNIVWESRKERLTLPTPKKKALVVHSCQRDPKAPLMTLLNQDLFYLKHGNSGSKKYILSLHKYHAVSFPDDDIKERTSRWVSKRLKKFNVYARYGVEHWKNMWAKQDHIRRQKQLRDNPHEVYSESKIVEIIKTTYELGHEHKFITEIIVRRANGKIDPITEPDYKYLNKNDIEDMYLLCINDKVKDYRETWLLGSLVVFIRASHLEKSS